MLQTPHALYIFTSKFAFRRSSVQFFEIRTSKSAPNTSCFEHFHFHICVSPQRRAFFRHQNFKKCSKHLMLCAFSLANLRFATAACNFSTSELPKVPQTPHVLSIFTSTFAFRHSGVQFFDIRTSKSAPNTSCFEHFHFHICVSPQRRAFFRHQNFKKCSKHLMLCAFSIFRHQNFQKCPKHRMF